MSSSQVPVESEAPRFTVGVQVLIAISVAIYYLQIVGIAGTLENTSWLNPTMEVWCETAQPWIEIDLTREHADRNPPLAA